MKSKIDVSDFTLLLTVLNFIACIVCWLIAVWVGDSRFGWTGAILLAPFAGLVLLTAYLKDIGR